MGANLPDLSQDGQVYHQKEQGLKTKILFIVFWYNLFSPYIRVKLSMRRALYIIFWSIDMIFCVALALIVYVLVSIGLEIYGIKSKIGKNGKNKRNRML